MIVIPDFIGFLGRASRRERRALLAATLGWTLDAMDVTLYAMVIPPLARELHLSAGKVGLIASAALVSSAAGGLLFGILADRAGRRLAMMLSIGLYSLFTAACGLSRGMTDLIIFRVLLGLGMGGEWGAGAALVVETWNARDRSKALGIMQSGFAIGYSLAAMVAAVILPRWGWRAVFFVGLLPAFLTLWIQHDIEESPIWLELKRQAPSSTLRKHPMFTKRYRRILVTTTSMGCAALFGWWGLFTWIPPYLALSVAQGGRGLTLAASSSFIAVMQAGMWLGYVTHGAIGDRFGRKKTYVLFLLVASALVPLYGGASSQLSLLVLGPLLAYFGTGHFTGFGVITAELFPTAFRTTAMGLSFNFGRALSAAAPWLVGLLAERHGLGAAFWISGLAYLIAAALGLGLPEADKRTLA